MRAPFSSLWQRAKVRASSFVAASAMLALTGCSAGNAWPFPGGQYPFDILPEMHYSQSYRSQEPRRLYPPDGSVPVTGSFPVVDAAAASRLQNPVPRTQNAVRGDQLYAINCGFCHGEKGLGDGRAGIFLKANNGKEPANLTLGPTTSKSDGDLFYILTRGLNYNPEGTVNGMPAFGNLLTPEERWLLVNKIRRLSTP